MILFYWQLVPLKRGLQLGGGILMLENGTETTNQEETTNGTDTTNQENGTDTTNQDNRTFTQDEVNAIVRDRVKKEREKYADYDAFKDKAGKYDQAIESGKKEKERADGLQIKLDELTQANSIRTMKEKVSKETTVPVDLLTGSTEEECKKQADAILKFAKPTYPGTKDNTTSTGGNVDNSDIAELARKLFKGE